MVAFSINDNQQLADELREKYIKPLPEGNYTSTSKKEEC